MIQLVGLTAETDILDIDPGHLAILGRYRAILSPLPISTICNLSLGK